MTGCLVDRGGVAPLSGCGAVPPVHLQGQRGAVLVVSLVLLVVLTFLAVTALNTSNLEEKMANNTQEAQRAFQTAESGIADTFADSSMFNLTVEQVNNIDDFGVYDAHGEVRTNFRQWTNPPRGSGYSITSFSAAHFEMSATGEAGSGAATTINAGAYQIAPKAG